MRTLLIYYSWSGKTKDLATKLASGGEMEIYEIRDKKKPGKASAFTKGVVNASRMTRTPIEPVSVDLNGFDRIVLMAPVWAGHPAPAINNVFDMLPAGKQVEVILTSTSGKSSCEDKVKALIESRGCKMAEFKDMKS